MIPWYGEAFGPLQYFGLTEPAGFTHDWMWSAWSHTCPSSWEALWLRSTSVPAYTTDSTPEQFTHTHVRPLGEGTIHVGAALLSKVCKNSLPPRLFQPAMPSCQWAEFREGLIHTGRGHQASGE